MEALLVETNITRGPPGYKNISIQNTIKTCKSIKIKLVVIK